MYTSRIQICPEDLKRLGEWSIPTGQSNLGMNTSHQLLEDLEVWTVWTATFFSDLLKGHLWTSTDTIWFPLKFSLHGLQRLGPEPHLKFWLLRSTFWWLAIVGFNFAQKKSNKAHHQTVHNVYIALSSLLQIFIIPWWWDVSDIPPTRWYQHVAWVYQRFFYQLFWVNHVPWIWTLSLETLSFFVSELLYIYDHMHFCLARIGVSSVMFVMADSSCSRACFCYPCHCSGRRFPKSVLLVGHHPPLSSLTTSKKKVAKTEMRLRAEGVDVDMAFGPPYPKR